MLIPRKKTVRNVVLISIDTCRADHLSCYGFDKKTTPNIDALAEEGILFKNAVSPVGLTLPAHSSIFTGTYPLYHGVHDNINQRLDESNLTLAEVLKDNGFSTAAAISAYVLFPQFGTDQGFDYYNSTFEVPVGRRNDVERRAEETCRVACDYIEQNSDKPFFFFLHFYDPHVDYDPPEPFATEFKDDPYSGEIAYVDHYIGKVVDKLKQLDLYDSTLIIIVGDHGEGLGEHGEAEHGYFVYQSTSHVPFIIRAPGNKNPIVVNEVVSLVDIFPTVLSYLDIDIPDYVQGEDLSVYTSGKPKKQSKRQVFCEAFTPTKYGCNPSLAIVTEKWKYIDTTRSELYDLDQSPIEEDNLILKESKRARLMQGNLHEMIAGFASGDSSSDYQIDEQSRKKLESMGYVGSSDIDATPELDKSKPDPKDMIEYHEYIQKVTYLLYHKRFDEATVICDKMLKGWPDMPNTYLKLALLSRDKGDLTRSIKYGKKYLLMMSEQRSQQSETLGFSPQNAVVMVQKVVGNACLELKRYKEAIKYFNAILEKKPDYLEVYNGLAVALFELGKFDNAINAWKKSLQLNYDDAEIHHNLAGAYYKRENFDKTLEHWQKALELKPGWEEVRENIDKLRQQIRKKKFMNNLINTVEADPGDFLAHNKLGIEYYRQGRVDRAIFHWQEAIRSKPDWPEVHNTLATAYYRQKNAAKAIEHWSLAVKLKPDWADALNNLAWILATTEDEQLRSPVEAVRNAEIACELTSSSNAEMLDTLSVAYASDGRFADAIKTADKALDLAQRSKQKKVAEDIKLHLGLYRAGKGYVEQD